MPSAGITWRGGAHRAQRARLCRRSQLRASKRKQGGARGPGGHASRAHRGGPSAQVRTRGPQRDTARESPEGR
eukprot:8487123-Alexandrium_andersonii.AAC.1